MDSPPRLGQRVTVDLDGTQIEGVFYFRVREQDFPPDQQPEGGVDLYGWVKRDDTGEVEGFAYADMTPFPEADIRISIGSPTENVPDERREATETLAADLGAITGLDVDLEVIERVPRRYGLGLVEWTAIYIGVKVADTLIEKVTSDLYEKAKQWFSERKEKGEGRPNKGFVIYGPDGKPLRRWDTKKRRPRPRRRRRGLGRRRTLSFNRRLVARKEPFAVKQHGVAARVTEHAEHEQDVGARFAHACAVCVPGPRDPANGKHDRTVI